MDRARRTGPGRGGVGSGGGDLTAWPGAGVCERRGCRRARRPGLDDGRRCGWAVARGLGGFSLVELMVVVALIALLLSILVPALGQSKQVAREVVCRTNLRQIGQALHTYLDDNDQTTPFCYARTQDVVITCWAPRLRALMGRDNKPFWCPARPGVWRWRRIYRYDADVPHGSSVRYATLEDARRYGFLKDEMLPVGKVIPFSYGWNDWGAAPAFTRAGMGGDEWGGDRWKVTAYMIDHPDSMIAVADKIPTPPNSWWGFNIDPTSWWEHPGRAHRDGADILWADGHVNWRPTDSIIIGDQDHNPDGWDNRQRNIARLWNNNNHWRPRR